MADLFGYVEGNRGPTTRLGSKKSGLLASVNSWDTKVIVRYYWDDDVGEMMVLIEASDLKESGCTGNARKVLFKDTEKALREKMR